MTTQYPPLIQGFIEIQKKYPDFIVLTEVGGFFEIWQLDDLGIGHAAKASQILDIVLTRRDKSKLDSPRMAGFPSYAVEGYIKKLVSAGETVVVVKQEITGKKSDNNKNVKRFIERIVSPATTISDIVDAKANYFACCYTDAESTGIALADLSTGYVSVSEMNTEDAIVYLEKVRPIEITFNGEPILKKESNQIFHSILSPITRQSSAGLILSKVYDIENPSSHHSTTLTQLGLELWPMGSLAIANLLNFLSDYNPLLLKRLSSPKVINLDSSLFLSKNAYLSLDIFEFPLQTNSSKTLYGVLNQCKTAMGRRVLQRWIHQPLTDKEAIEARLDLVQETISTNNFLPELAQVYDISRLLRRMALKNIEPHEIPGFYKSLKIANACLTVKQGRKEASKALNFLDENLNISLLEKGSIDLFLACRGSLRKKLSFEEENWNLAKKKLDKETKRISSVLDSNKLRTQDRTDSVVLTGPKGLKSKCEETGISFKLKASELQITDQKWESAAYEEITARSTLTSKSRSLWEQLQADFTSLYGRELLDFSEAVGEVDVLSTFAKLSKERGYVRPNFVKSSITTAKLSKMRHPILELSKDAFEGFVPNEICLRDKSILVIYGANAAGKSTVLKGLALNIIMAQIGCFVAASNAELSIFDSIMTRMTTYDSLSEGLSTFTMEMIELQNALKRSNERSLFLFDEIGRGTSVEDGEAIAFGILDHLNSNESKAITLFATHYHSLFENIKDFEKVNVKHFSCDVVNGNLVFERELKDGPGSGSYGLAVAKTCGVPESIIRVGQNYKRQFKRLMVSRYNKKIQSTICELCKEKEAQETHHLQEQRQGKVKEIEINGIKSSINNVNNLVLLCGTCHKKVTKEKLIVKKQRVLGTDNYLVTAEKSKKE